MQLILIISARKRSLRRLCFHRCLSVHRGCVCHTHAGQTPPWTDTHSWADAPRQTPLGRTPSLCADTSKQTPPPPTDIPLGREPSLPNACWDTHPPCPVQAGIRSTSGRCASPWNVFLFLQLILQWSKKASEVEGQHAAYR